MKWFRLWTDIINDPKMKKLSDSQFRTFIYLLCIASEQEQNGVISYSEKELSWLIRRTETQVKSTIKTLRGHKILCPLDKSLRFLNWIKRQPLSDNHAQNKRKQRENEKMSQDMSQDSLKNVFPPEQSRADTETEQKKKEKAKEKESPADATASSGLSLGSPSGTQNQKPQGQPFDLIWDAYPIKRDREKAKKIFDKHGLHKHLDKMLAAVNRQIENKLDCENKKIFCPEFPLLKNWLTGKRWEDEIITPEDLELQKRKKLEDDYARANANKAD